MVRTQRVMSFLLMSLFVFGSAESADNDREALFRSEKGHALSNHVIKSLIVRDAIECSFQCLQTKLCKSINYQHGNIENRQCQLNNKSKGSASSGDYQAASGFTYYEKDPCVPSPCSFAGSCSKVNGVEEFNCTCLPGFKGRLCESERSGWFSRNPGASCKAILDAGDALHDGTYWVDPGNQGNPMRVHCDMTTDEGGWLLISNIVVQSSSQSAPSSLTTSFRDITNYNNKLTLISSTNLHELRQLMPFTQLRFQCRKASVGRTVHVITTQNDAGASVVNYFTSESNTQAVSCGSFTRGQDDDSWLGAQCSSWKNGKWGHPTNKNEWKLYNHAFYIANKAHWVLSSAGYRCDANTASIATGDYWKISIR